MADNHQNNRQILPAGRNFAPNLEGAELHIEYRVIGDVKPLDNNPRTHSKKQVREIAASIQAFGFTNPILIDEGDQLIAGHGRLRKTAKAASISKR